MDGGVYRVWAAGVNTESWKMNLGGGGSGFPFGGEGDHAVGEGFEDFLDVVFDLDGGEGFLVYGVGDFGRDLEKIWMEKRLRSRGRVVWLLGRPKPLPGLGPMLSKSLA